MFREFHDFGAFETGGYYFLFRSLMPKFRNERYLRLKGQGWGLGSGV